jgi:hypothetical protein
VDDKPGGEKRARVPTDADLARIARSLNDHQARYAVVGGFAVIHHGLARATNDIDLLIDPSPDNVERVRQALAILEDHASLELRTTDIAEYNVVRVADEIVVDLIGAAAGVTLDELEGAIEHGEVDGVPIPYPTAAALLRTKQTVRDKDVGDRLFLESLLAETAG